MKVNSISQVNLYYDWMNYRNKMNTIKQKAQEITDVFEKELKKELRKIDVKG